MAGVGAQVMRVQGDPAVVARRLNRSALVSYAEPNFILRATAIPNDPLFPELYGLNNTGQTGGSSDADIDGPEGWDAAGLGAFPATGGTKIGIVDTGIDQTHPELSGKTVDCGSAFGGTVDERHLRGRQHARHPRGRHDRREGEQRDRRGRRGVQLEPDHLQGALHGGGHRPDLGHRQLHQLDARSVAPR